MNPRKPTLIIAEIGINHKRSIIEAFELVDAAIWAGADVVKTQLEDPTEYTLTYAEIKNLYENSKEKIKFACTPFDVPSLKFLLDNTKMEFVKLASTAPKFPDLVNAAGRSGLPVILSTGGCDNEEIANALEYLSFSATLLHCISEYPAPLEKLNLRRIVELKKSFGRPVGYSDHSANPMIPAFAVAMGAKVIEAHLTLDKTQEGPDHKASLEPHEFAVMVANVRMAEKAC